jgi:hypothetical protein
VDWTLVSATTRGREAWTGNTASFKECWKKNRILIAILLAIWFLVCYLFAIFMARPLQELKVGQLTRLRQLTSRWRPGRGSAGPVAVAAMLLGKLDV